MLRLTLSLPCPINRMYRSLEFKGKGGGRYSKPVLSRPARERRDKLVAEVWEQCGGRPVPLDGDVQVSVVIYPRDKRTPDVDAYMKHLLDSLTKAGVWHDDKQVVHTTTERMEQEFPGRIEVEIWPIQGE